MKIKIKECVASSTWVCKKDQIVDTDTNENIDDAQALRWLNAGIAVAVKEPEKKGKRKASIEKSTSEKS